MLAFIFAIALSFAFVDKSADKDYYATKYIEVPGGWATIEVNCHAGSLDCSVKFSGAPSMTFPVYDQKDTDYPTDGNGELITITGSVPSPDDPEL